jgi:cyclic pyranopterin phosphate synthase
MATATAITSLTDGLGRVHRALRVSVTDRCNLRCRYCMPAEGMDWLPKAQLLTFDELERLTHVFAAMGIRDVRLTGGEPLVRKDLSHLVGRITATPGIREVSITTNGVLLADQIDDLVAAGLARVNVSLDSLDPRTFAAMTRRDAHARVWAGIEAAAAAGLAPIRLNAVLVRGRNDHEVVDFARLARARAFEVRFIEFMPLEHGQQWGTDVLVPGREVRERIDAVFPLRPRDDQDPHAPSQDWLFADGAPGLVGFISSVTEPFCAECNRIRLTADGKLRTCLFSLREHDLREALRAGASDDEIAARLAAAVATKEKKHHISDGLFVKPERTMSAIGG